MLNMRRRCKLFFLATENRAEKKNVVSANVSTNVCQPRAGKAKPRKIAEDFAAAFKTGSANSDFDLFQTSDGTIKIKTE